jgi:hypothetical protein
MLLAKTNSLRILVKYVLMKQLWVFQRCAIGEEADMVTHIAKDTVMNYQQLRILPTLLRVL